MGDSGTSDDDPDVDSEKIEARELTEAEKPMLRKELSWRTHGGQLHPQRSQPRLPMLNVLIEAVALTVPRSTCKSCTMHGFPHPAP